MKHYLLLSILALAFMASCQNEELVEAPLQVKDKMEVSATLVDESQTRTQHSSDFKKVLCSENDAISVFEIGEKSCHDRYYLKEGAGKTSADFQWDKTYGTITGGVEGEDSQKDYSFVGVYPFMEGTSVEFSNDIYTINTVIPTNQKYAENSFGQEAFVMVGVDRNNSNSKPNIAFKNVGTILIFPLNGEGTIQSVTLKSEKSKIAGKAVVTVSEKENFIPSTTVNEGESEITLSCGEGVQLKGEEYTNFCFVLAPGVYDDLVVEFTDVDGNDFKQKIENPNHKEMKRSMSYNMPKMTFKAQGTEQTDLWVEAEVSASMTAERIIPSLDLSNVMGWAKNLKDKPNTKALIEEAITYITLKNYKAAYDVLDGIPGFVRDTKEFNAKGSFIQKVEYNQVSYLKPMLEEIDKITDFESLLKFMSGLENNSSDLRNKIEEYLDSVLKENPTLKGLMKILDGVTLVSICEKLYDIDIAKKIIDSLFSEENMDIVKKSLRDIVTEIESANAGNLLEKEKAIDIAKEIALSNAKAEAVQKIEEDLALINETNLNKLYAGPWGVFQKILENDNCIEAFNQRPEVYDALVKLSQVVEEMIAYDKGSFSYSDENWWVIEGAPSEE